MNFYKHHIGDYEAATSHLSLIEDAIYSRLLRMYYRDEKPLPVEVAEAARKARARDEEATVKAILIEFFYLADDGWHHKRCDEEIAAASAIAETNRRIAVEREERKRATKQARSVPGASNGLGTGTSGEREPSQTPDSTSQTPPSASQTDAGRACVLMRQAGCVTTNPSHPDLVDALIEGVTPEQLADTAREAVELGVRKPFPWAIATARGRRAEARPMTGASRGSDRKLSPGEQARAAQAGRTGAEPEYGDVDEARLIG